MASSVGGAYRASGTMSGVGTFTASNFGSYRSVSIRLVIGEFTGSIRQNSKLRRLADLAISAFTVLRANWLALSGCSLQNPPVAKIPLLHSSTRRLTSGWEFRNELGFRLPAKLFVLGPSNRLSTDRFHPCLFGSKARFSMPLRLESCWERFIF